MNPSSPVWAVIPASGIGNRMHSETPKQYLMFEGKTILEHCLDRLLSHPRIEAAVVVLNGADEYWEKLSYHSSKPLYTTAGGRERHHTDLEEWPVSPRAGFVQPTGGEALPAARA